MPVDPAPFIDRHQRQTALGRPLPHHLLSVLRLHPEREPVPIKPLPQHFQNPFGVVVALERHHEVISKPHHVWAKSQNGKKVVRQRTAKSRLARALMAIKEWCRTNRHLPIPAQRDRLAAKLVGHYAYYGITGNFMPLQQYFRQVTKIWRKWLERRSRKKELLVISCQATRSADGSES